MHFKEELKHAAWDFWIFGMKNIRSCVFAGSFFLVLALSNVIPLFGLARYDFIFLAAILIQVVLVLTKLETKDEVKVIALFHLIGFILEAFKTSPAIGSWSYPEPGFFKILNVPLYSGFMYAAIGSYISQSWKQFNTKLHNYPSYYWSVPLCVLIYLNFFTHHIPHVPDLRWVLVLAVLIVFGRTVVSFTITDRTYKMPLPLSFLLIAFFIWVAENMASFLGAWQYPDQAVIWHVVSLGKISSWFLLVIISFITVADLKQLKASRERRKGEKSE